jgi:hypothetical protein
MTGYTENGPGEFGQPISLRVADNPLGGALKALPEVGHRAWRSIGGTSLNAYPPSRHHRACRHTNAKSALKEFSQRIEVKQAVHERL